MEKLLHRTRTIFTRQLLIELICYAYSLLFLYASVYKLLDVGYFSRQLAQSPLIGSYSGLLAFFVPGIELVVVALLVYAPWRKIGLYLGGLVMLAFTLYIAWILLFAPTVPCACGGIFVSMSWTGHLVFNAVFVVLAALAIWLTHINEKK